MPPSMPAKQIIGVEQDKGESKLFLLEDNLRSLLLSDDVGDKPVVVVSVAGEFRTGKSFLLSMMSRYLMAEDKANWLVNTSGSFKWKSGDEAHTNGIFMSQPIPFTLESGDEVLFILLDTQGLFDDESNETDSTKMFALSTLFSSVQVYNINKNIKKTDLDHLKLFTEYGLNALQDDKEKVFQHLVFLIRDWAWPKKHAFGSRGWNELVEKRLKSDKTYEHAQKLFTDVSGFLMPYPGKDMAESDHSDWDEKLMDPEFKQALDTWMSWLFSPETLPVKMIGNDPVTCRQLVTVVEKYTALFGSKELPEVKGLLEATAECINNAAVDETFGAYKRQMQDKLASVEMPDEKQLLDMHQDAKTEALKSWKSKRIMSDPSKETNFYHEELVNKMKSWYDAMETGVLKAYAANQETAKLYIEEAHKNTDRSAWNPGNFLKSDLKAQTIETHSVLKKDILTKFDSLKQICETYKSEEVRLKLVQDLDQMLAADLEMNRKCRMYHMMWIGLSGGAVAVPLAAAAGAVGAAGSIAAAVTAIGTTSEVAAVAGVTAYAGAMAGTAVGAGVNLAVGEGDETKTKKK